MHRLFLNRLFAQTQLQTTFAINMLALVRINPSLRFSLCGRFWMNTWPSRKRSSSGERGMI